MSFQIAMMAGMAAMTVASAAQQASAAGKAGDRAAASIGEGKRQADIEANIMRMGSEVRAGGFQLQAAQTDVTAAEVGVQTKQRELARRVEMARLMEINEIDMVARGGVSTGQDSLGAIQTANRAAAEADISNFRMAGEGMQRRLSFEKSNFGIQAMGEKLRSVFADVSSAGKQKQMDMQLADVRAGASDAATSALLAGGAKLFSIGATYGKSADAKEKGIT